MCLYARCYVFQWKHQYHLASDHCFTFLTFYIDMTLWQLLLRSPAPPTVNNWIPAICIFAYSIASLLTMIHCIHKKRLYRSESTFSHFSLLEIHSIDSLCRRAVRTS